VTNFRANKEDRFYPEFKEVCLEASNMSEDKNIANLLIALTGFLLRFMNQDSLLPTQQNENAQKWA
jgi:hypothetical protein